MSLVVARARRRWVCWAWLGLVAACPAWAEAEQVRLLLSVGSNYGRPDDAVLQFAEQDATRVRDVFVELGEVDAARAVVLARPTAAQVKERFSELNGRVAELHAAGKSVQLIVFLSAHGKAGLVHLTGTSLPLEELRGLAAHTGAELNVVIVDACESGVGRDKGARKGPAYALSLQRPDVSGSIFIASSGSHEASQEWDTLAGSLFTHHLLTALRGDADFNQDGRVTVMEAYAYAEQRTVAESIDVGQHPQFDLGVAGAQDVVLTDLRRASAQVLFGEGLEGRFVVISQPRPDIVAEVFKRSGAPVKLAVPSGRYLVRQTQGFKVALQEVELPYGGVASVDARRFVVRDYSEVALKGGEAEFHPNAAKVLVSGLTPTVGDTPWRWGVGGAYRLALGSWWFSVGALIGTTRYRAVQLTTSELRGAGRLAAGPRFWFGPVIVAPSLALELSATNQHFVRDDEAAIRKVYGSLADRLVWGVAVGPQVNAEVPLTGPLFAAVSVAGWVRELPSEAQASVTVGVDAEVGLGVRW